MKSKKCRAAGIAAVKHEPVTLKVKELETAPWNPRREFDQKLVEDIADDIRSGKGLIQRPAVWRSDAGRYCVIAGNTRIEACRVAGAETVDVELFDVTEAEAMAMTFKENEQRADVYPVNQALLIGKIFQGEGRTVEDIVSLTGLHKSSVYDYLAIARRVLPEILELAEYHPSQFTKSTLMDLTEYTFDYQRSVVDEWREDLAEDESDDREWSPSLWKLRQGTQSLNGCRFAGPGSVCATCPKNTANAGSLPGFETDGEGTQRGARCEDVKCYQATEKAYWNAFVEKKLSKVRGETVKLGGEWEFNQSCYQATEKSPTPEKPCAYWILDKDHAKVTIRYGISKREVEARAAEKRAAEKAERAAASAEARMRREVVDRLESSIEDGIDQDAEDYDERAHAAHHLAFRRYVEFVLSAVADGDTPHLSMWNELVDRFMESLCYGSAESAKEVVLALMGEYPIDLTDDEREWLAPVIRRLRRDDDVQNAMEDQA